MRLWVKVVILLQLLPSVAMGMTFEERWSNMVEGALIEKAIRDAQQERAAKRAVEHVITHPERDAPRYVPPSRHVTHHHRGYSCRHIWHGKHWHC